jgi:large subunit ribosomal protein L6
MSRAGKNPIKIIDGVSIKVDGTNLVVNGPKGELKIALDTKNAGLVDIKIEDNEVLVIPKDSEDKESRTMWGTMARNIKNAVIGVTMGFSKDIVMKGVGFKAAVNGNKLTLIAGYSHDVILDVPNGLTVEMGSVVTEFSVKGTDKNLVGQFSDKICKVRKVEPYKGKGIYYKGQKVRRKEGKKK